LGEVTGVDIDTLDLADLDAVRDCVRALRPSVILNAAAYTAVDKAEDETALSARLNADVPAVLAAEAKAIAALLVHYSTDYVYDGEGDRPYVETDATRPVNAYGRTKLAGDEAIRREGGHWLVFRTCWVFADRGGNFPRTMLRLAAERETLKVVDDQFGAPTPARLIADVTAQAVVQGCREIDADQFESGLYHLSASGVTSWHGFASAVVDGARRRGMPLKAREVLGISAREYRTRAARPSNSRLATEALSRRFGLAMPPWEQGLELVLDSLADRNRGA
jgi:dTDP-4-dehydrorhamnose reductase